MLDIISPEHKIQSL